MITCTEEKNFKNEDKKIETNLKQIKKEFIELLEKKYGEIGLARHLKHLRSNEKNMETSKKLI